MIINTSHLQKNYTIEDMNYLDSSEASVLYKKQAEIVRSNNCKCLVDVGCRTGEINRYLNNHDYFYYGFDTSKEPIAYAQKKYPQHKFEVRDWDDLLFISTDVVIFSSVLIYSKDPISMFEHICNFYNTKRAIVHEVNNKNTEELPYTDLDYFNKYEHTRYDFDLNIPVGHRTILDVQYR